MIKYGDITNSAANRRGLQISVELESQLYIDAQSLGCSCRRREKLLAKGHELGAEIVQ